MRGVYSTVFFFLLFFSESLCPSWWRCDTQLGPVALLQLGVCHFDGWVPSAQTLFGEPSSSCLFCFFLFLHLSSSGSLHTAWLSQAKPACVDDGDWGMFSKRCGMEACVLLWVIRNLARIGFLEHRCSWCGSWWVYSAPAFVWQLAFLSSLGLIYWGDVLLSSFTKREGRLASSSGGILLSPTLVRIAFSTKSTNVSPLCPGKVVISVELG